jgi:hypothetical protein
VWGGHGIFPFWVVSAPFQADPIFLLKINGRLTAEVFQGRPKTRTAMPYVFQGDEKKFGFDLIRNPHQKTGLRRKRVR